MNSTRTKQLTADERFDINYRKAKGESISRIARALKTSRATVRLWASRWESEHCLKDRPRPGAPQKLSAGEQAEFLVAADKDCRLDLEEYANKKNCSVQTLKNILFANGYYIGSQTTKPDLTAPRKKKRLEFCLKYKDWTFKDWCKVLFTDESGFSNKRSSPKKIIKKRGSTKNRNSSYFARSVPRLRVNVWGCITIDKKGQLLFTSANFNSVEYLNSVLKKGTFLDYIFN